MFMYKNVPIDVSNTYNLISKKSSFNKLNINDIVKKNIVYSSNNTIVYESFYNNKTVAVKKFLNSKSGNSYVTKFFTKDIHICKIHSENLLLIYGFFVEIDNDIKNFSIVMDYCKRGYLRDVLINEKNLTLETRIDIILDAVYALMCYYNYESVYKYISNISYMVTEHYKLKLLFMGLEDTIYKNNKHIPTIHYISPKCLNNIYELYNKKDDIYSLGILIWEIMTSNMIFENKSSKEIYQLVKNGLTLSITNNDTINNIIKKSLSHNEDIRPNIENIFNTIISCKFNY
ncbi:tyrosine protein kinase-like protein [Hypsugopox virus]|nr:tyrosine protein kinase-like protein [Hypsugopox virus]